MARGKNKGILHIKKRTEGTSNELSFSVLDAKSNAVDVSGASPRTVSELGKVSVFTVADKQTGEPADTATGFGASRRARMQGAGVISGGTTLSPQIEIAHRKRHRRFTRVLQVLGVLALVAVLAVAGTQFAGGLLEKQQRSHVAIDTAIDLLAQTDEAILSLDNAVMQPAQSSNTILKEQLANLAAASSLLDRATNSAEAAASLEIEEPHLEAAMQVKEAAAARKDLILRGAEVLSMGANAKRATDLAKQSWDAALAGDALARQAVEVSEGDNPNYTRSSELSTEAVEQFQEALVLVRRAAVAYDQADFSLLEDYLEKRSSAQQNALAANASAQEGEDALAAVNETAYNAAEQEAATLAQKLPSNPVQPILDVYAQAGSQADAAYQEARERASRADATLRSYLESRNA